MNNSITINFQGPYTFINNDTVFENKFSKSQGVYLWIVHDSINSRRYIHYIGETTSLAKRHKQHLTEILGLNYAIFDPKSIKNGVSKTLWPGMWRDKSDLAAINTIEAYNNISVNVIKYIEAIEIYFAPTDFEKKLRRHIEGSIAYHLKSELSDKSIFYPKDNRTGRSRKTYNKQLIIKCHTAIEGLAAKIKL